MRNVTVFEPNLKGAFPRIPKGVISVRAEARMSRIVRRELQNILSRVVDDAFDEGGYTSRSGNAYNIMRRGGVRVFGTTFNSLRGHIVGPSYIKAQEEGATITPKSAEALAIPLPPALRPDGTPKLAGPKNWRNVVPTFIYVSKKNKRAYIAYKNPANGRLVLLYSLVESVEIREKAALRKAWDARKDELIRAFGQAMLLEFGTTDLGELARVKTSGGSGRRRR